MKKDNTQYFNDEWNTEKPVFINGIEQNNIGTIEHPYYMPKLTEEQLKHFINKYKSNIKDANKHTK